MTLAKSPAFEIRQNSWRSSAFEWSYSDPHVPALPAMRHHHIRLDSETLTESFLESLDCALIVTDHTSVDYARVVRHAKLVVDTRNATAGLPHGCTRIVKA